MNFLTLYYLFIFCLTIFTLLHLYIHFIHLYIMKNNNICIIWIDKNIFNNENQGYVKRLKKILNILIYLQK